MKCDELRSMSTDDVLLLFTQVREELIRRKVGAEVVEVHPGNTSAGKPLPLLVRVLKRLPTLPPADLAKVETLLDGWAKARSIHDGRQG